jgi:hypothetical protein
MFPYYRLNHINGFDCPKDNCTDHYKWDRTPIQKPDCIRYTYWTLMQQWVHFGHKGQYFNKYKFHQPPKTVQERREKGKPNENVRH